MQLEILSPQKTHHRGKVDLVTLPGTMGSFQILNNHAPLIASLQKGVLSFVKDGKVQSMEIADGFVEVIDNKITVCIDSVYSTY